MSDGVDAHWLGKKMVRESMGCVAFLFPSFQSGLVELFKHEFLYMTDRGQRPSASRRVDGSLWKCTAGGRGEELGS